MTTVPSVQFFRSALSSPTRGLHGSAGDAPQVAPPLASRSLNPSSRASPVPEERQAFECFEHTRLSGEAGGTEGPLRCAERSGDLLWCGELSGDVVLRHKRSGQVRQTIPRHKFSKSQGVALSLLAVESRVWGGLSDGHLVIWDSYTAEKVDERHIHTGGITALLEHNRFVFSGSQDCRIVQWDPQTHECLRQYIGTSGIRCLYGFVTSLAAGYADSVVTIWDSEAGCRAKDLYPRPTVERIGSVTALVHSNGHLWAGGEDGTVYVWNSQTFEQSKVLDGHTHSITVLASANGHIWSAAMDRKVVIWDSESFARVQVIDFQSGHVTQLLRVATPEGAEVISITSDRILQMWRAKGRAAPAKQGIEEELQRRNAENSQLREQLANVLELLSRHQPGGDRHALRRTPVEDEGPMSLKPDSLSALQEQLREVVGQRNRIMQENLQLKQGLQQELEQLRNDLRAQDTRCADVYKQKRAAEDLAKRQEAEILAIDVERAALRHELASLEKEKQQLREENSRLLLQRVQMDGDHQHKAVPQLDLSRVQAVAAETEQELVESLQSKLSDFGVERIALQRTIEEKEAQLQYLEQRLQQTEDELKQAAAKLQTFELERSFGEEGQAAVEEISLHRKDQLNDELHIRIASQQQTIKSLIGDVEKLTSELDALRTANTELEEHRMEMLNEVTTADAEMQALREQMDDLRRENQLLRVDHSLAEEHVDKLVRQVKELAQQRDELTRQLIHQPASDDDKVERIQQLTAEIEALKGEVQPRGSEWEAEMQRDLKQMRSQISVLTVEKKQATEHARRLAAQLEQAQDSQPLTRGVDLDALRTDIAALTELLSSRTEVGQPGPGQTPLSPHLAAVRNLLAAIGEASAGASEKHEEQGGSEDRTRQQRAELLRNLWTHHQLLQKLASKLRALKASPTYKSLPLKTKEGLAEIGEIERLVAQSRDDYGRILSTHFSSTERLHVGAVIPMNSPPQPARHRVAESGM